MKFLSRSCYSYSYISCEVAICWGCRIQSIRIRSCYCSDIYSIWIRNWSCSNIWCKISSIWICDHRCSIIHSWISIGSKTTCYITSSIIESDIIWTITRIKIPYICIPWSIVSSKWSSCSCRYCGWVMGWFIKLSIYSTSKCRIICGIRYITVPSIVDSICCKGSVQGIRTIGIKFSSIGWGYSYF